MQIVEIDAAKALDLPVDDGGIFQRGGNQLVEIDVLDVEGLAHMRAAGLQDVGNLDLVIYRDRIRS